MKKILVLILAVLLIMALPFVTFAEEAEPPVAEENVAPTEEVTTEVEEEPTMTETIVEWVKSNFEEIAVIFGLAASAFYGAITRRGLNGSIGTLNNNAITIAENSAKAVDTGAKKMEDMANRVIEFEKKADTILEKMASVVDENQSLTSLLNATKIACLEMSNEVAELLVLANIPTSKKEELYSRHTKAVHELEAVEGVISNDGEKA